MDRILHFLKGKQQETFPSTEKLTEWINQLEKKLADNYNSVQKVGQILHYIIHFIELAYHIDNREQVIDCMMYFKKLQDLLVPDLAKDFVTRCSIRVFDVIIGDNITFFAKRELLKLYYVCAKQVSVQTRRVISTTFPETYLLKLIDVISSFGDYDFQVILIETIFSLYGKQALNKRLDELMPESEELSKKFLQIKGETFYDDVRIFLGNINLITGKIFSILCSDLILGDVRCYDTVTQTDGLWINFNNIDRIMSWNCSNTCFSDKFTDSGLVQDSITLMMTDIENVNIQRSCDQAQVLIIMNLCKPCISSSANCQPFVDKAKLLTIFMDESEQSKILVSNILPKLLEATLSDETTQDVDISKKISRGSTTYKPLKINMVKKSYTKSNYSTNSCKQFDPISLSTSRIESDSVPNTSRTTNESYITKEVVKNPHISQVKNTSCEDSPDLFETAQDVCMRVSKSKPIRTYIPMQNKGAKLRDISEESEMSTSQLYETTIEHGCQTAVQNTENDFRSLEVNIFEDVLAPAKKLSSTQKKNIHKTIGRCASETNKQTEYVDNENNGKFNNISGKNKTGLDNEGIIPTNIGNDDNLIHEKDTYYHEHLSASQFHETAKDVVPNIKNLDKDSQNTLEVAAIAQTSKITVHENTRSFGKISKCVLRLNQDHDLENKVPTNTSLVKNVEVTSEVIIPAVNECVEKEGLAVSKSGKKKNTKALSKISKCVPRLNEDHEIEKLENKVKNNGSLVKTVGVVSEVISQEVNECVENEGSVVSKSGKEKNARHLGKISKCVLRLNQDHDMENKVKTNRSLVNVQVTAEVLRAEVDECVEKEGSLVSKSGKEKNTRALNKISKCVTNQDHDMEKMENKLTTNRSLFKTVEVASEVISPEVNECVEKEGTIVSKSGKVRLSRGGSCNRNHNSNSESIGDNICRQNINIYSGSKMEVDFISQNVEITDVLNTSSSHNRDQEQRASNLELNNQTIPDKEVLLHRSKSVLAEIRNELTCKEKNNNNVSQKCKILSENSEENIRNESMVRNSFEVKKISGLIPKTCISTRRKKNIDYSYNFEEGQNPTSKCKTVRKHKKQYNKEESVYIMDSIANNVNDNNEAPSEERGRILKRHRSIESVVNESVRKPLQDKIDMTKKHRKYEALSEERGKIINSDRSTESVLIEPLRKLLQDVVKNTTKDVCQGSSEELPLSEVSEKILNRHRSLENVVNKPVKKPLQDKVGITKNKIKYESQLEERGRILNRQRSKESVVNEAVRKPLQDLVTNTTKDDYQGSSEELPLSEVRRNILNRHRLMESVVNEPVRKPLQDKVGMAKNKRKHELHLKERVVNKAVKEPLQDVVTNTIENVHQHSSEEITKVFEGIDELINKAEKSINKSLKEDPKKANNAACANDAGMLNKSTEHICRNPEHLNLEDKQLNSPDLNSTSLTTHVGCNFFHKLRTNQTSEEHTKLSCEELSKHNSEWQTHTKDIVLGEKLLQVDIETDAYIESLLKSKESRIHGSIGDNIEALSPNSTLKETEHVSDKLSEVEGHTCHNTTPKDNPSSDNVRENHSIVVYCSRERDNIINTYHSNTQTKDEKMPNKDNQPVKELDVFDKVLKEIDYEVFNREFRNSDDKKSKQIATSTSEFALAAESPTEKQSTAIALGTDNIPSTMDIVLNDSISNFDVTNARTGKNQPLCPITKSVKFEKVKEANITMPLRRNNYLKNKENLNQSIITSNQTFSTDTSARKRRKLYDPDSYISQLCTEDAEVPEKSVLNESVVQANTNQALNVKPAEFEPSINTKIILNKTVNESISNINCMNSVSIQEQQEEKNIRQEMTAKDSKTLVQHNLFTDEIYQKNYKKHGSHHKNRRINKHNHSKSLRYAFEKYLESGNENDMKEEIGKKKQTFKRNSKKVKLSRDASPLKKILKEDISLFEPKSILKEKLEKIKIISNISLNKFAKLNKQESNALEAEGVSSRISSRVKDRTSKDYVGNHGAKVAHLAPDWQSTVMRNGEFISVKSTDYRKKYLVIYFFQWKSDYLTSSLPKDVQELNERYNEFEEMDAIVAVCPLGLPCANSMWLENIETNLHIDLLVESTHKLSSSYNVYFHDCGLYGRSTFIVDPKGVMVWNSTSAISYPFNVDVILQVLKYLQNAAKHTKSQES